MDSTYYLLVGLFISFFNTVSHGAAEKNILNSSNQTLRFSGGCEFIFAGSLISSLIDTCKDDNSDECSTLFMDNPSLADEQTLLNQLLLVACAYNAPNIAEHLISIGANVDYKDPLGNTPLGVAIALNNPQCAEMLISCGVQSDDLFIDGQTPFEWAEQKEYPAIAKSLRKKNLSQTKRPSDYDSAKIQSARWIIIPMLAASIIGGSYYLWQKNIIHHYLGIGNNS